jgi:RNA polymerase sigma-70 factor (sigma-E family)
VGVQVMAGTDFDDYVRLRYRQLRRLAFLLCGDWAAADDAVQTALIRCEKRWASIGGGQQHAYVRQAVVNTTSTWRRRRRGHRPLSDLDHVASSEPDTDSRLAVLAALHRLPEGQRQVLVLRYYEGLTAHEIAAAQGVSAGTVKSRASRAPAALRESDLATLRPEART